MGNCYIFFIFLSWYGLRIVSVDDSSLSQHLLICLFSLLKVLGCISGLNLQLNFGWISFFFFFDPVLFFVFKVLKFKMPTSDKFLESFLPFSVHDLKEYCDEMVGRGSYEKCDVQFSWCQELCDPDSVAPVDGWSNDFDAKDDLLHWVLAPSGKEFPTFLWILFEYS